MNVSCQYVVRVDRNESVCQGLRGGIEMNQDSSSRSNESEKVRLFSCVYFYPSPAELYSEGEARGVISLTLTFFLFFYLDYKGGR